MRLRFTSSQDATGIELALPQGARAIDCRASYWRRLSFTLAGGSELFVHGNAAVVEVPAGAVRAHLLALPADGRDNSPDGFVCEVPVPVVLGG